MLPGPAMTADCSDHGGNTPAGAPPADAAPHSKPVGIIPSPLINEFRQTHRRRGVLIPLKTTQEVRQDHTVVAAYITRAPSKSANDVIS